MFLNQYSAMIFGSNLSQNAAIAEMNNQAAWNDTNEKIG